MEAFPPPDTHYNDMEPDKSLRKKILHNFGFHVISPKGPGCWPSIWQKSMVQLEPSHRPGDEPGGSTFNPLEPKEFSYGKGLVTHRYTPEN